MNNKEKKIKILFDISFAAYGQAGIMSDMRNTLEAMLSIPDIEIDFLIYSVSNDYEILNFNKSNAIKDEYAYTQLLSTLTGTRRIPDNKIPFIKQTKFIRNFIKSLFVSNIKSIKLPNKFKESIFRKYLAVGLGSDFLSKLSQVNIYVAPFTDRVLLYRIHSNLPLPKVSINTSGYDIFFCQTEVPIEVSEGTKKVIRHHDIIPYLMPDTEIDSYYRAKYIYKTIKGCIAQKAHFVCNSQKTLSELTENFPGADCSVVHCAISSKFKKNQDSEYLFQIIKSRLSNKLLIDSNNKIFTEDADWIKYTEEKSEEIIKAFNPNKDKYFLMVGMMDTRKNYKVALKGFDLMISDYKEQNPGSNIYMIVAGSIGNLDEESMSLLRNSCKKNKLIFLEKPSLDELVCLYSHAAALIFPSFNEGFGIPPIEAMGCECPVITSDIPVHREIQKDYSIFVSPYSHRDMAKAMITVTNHRNESKIQEAKIYSSNFIDSTTIKSWSEYIQKL